MNKQMPIIEVRKLKKFFPLKKKSLFQKGKLYIRAVEDVSLTIHKGETFGLVGESGCGKSTLGRVILQLYPPTSGSALYYGIPLREFNPKYILKEIDKLVKYQEKAKKAFQKSLVYDEKIAVFKSRVTDAEALLNVEEKNEAIKQIDKNIATLKAQKKEAYQFVIQELNIARNKYKEIIAKKLHMYVEPKWEEEVDNLIEVIQNDSENKAIIDYIDLLHVPHRNVLKAYSQVKKLRKQIAKLEIQKSLVGTNIGLRKALKAYERKSKNLKKEASRQLREGSRTCGEYILEAELPEIAKLMKEEELLHRANYHDKKLLAELSKKDNKLLNDLSKQEVINNYEKDKANALNIQDNTEKRAKLKELKIAYHQEIHKFNRLVQIAQLKETIQERETKQQEINNQLKQYRFSNVLPITERCLDSEYQEKMESNREYAINLQKLSKSEMRVLRQKLQIIFQDPYSSLDPRMTVGQAISEAVVEHGLYKKNSPELEEYIVDIMAKCGLDHYMIHRYPHQFSGGQRQRIVIARALALKPEFVVCDESVSALDVSIQSQILNLLQDLKEDSNLTYLFISHDLSVIKHVSDRIAVMYLGDIVELCKSDTLYDNPLHPYSKALISAIPTTTQKEKTRIILEGDIPSNIFPPSGCKFRTRCPIARGKCAKEKPEFKEIEPGHQVACHFYEETKNII